MAEILTQLLSRTDFIWLFVTYRFQYQITKNNEML